MGRVSISHRWPLWALPAAVLLTCGSGSGTGAAGPNPTETTAFVDTMDSFDVTRWEKSNWTNGSMFNCGFQPDHAVIAGGDLTLKLDDVPSFGKAYSSAEYRTLGTFGYGVFQTSMKAAKSSGIVSSFFLYADSRDEIDVEILGKDTTKVQFNYFVKGVGGHEKVVDLGFDSSADFHTYGIAWSAGGIRWYVDGALVWTVTASGAAMPGDAMKLMMNLWPGTGVDSWLGGLSYSEPLYASYDSVSYSPP